MLSLVDGFSWYNQITIALEDQEKIAFTYPWGTFYWNVMPFGLKNAGAKYQWVMTTIFHDMMHIFMEDYVDEIMEKSYTKEGHLEIVNKIFTRLEIFNFKLNLKKCVFGVTSTKLLGYIVSEKGIKVDLAKVNVIMEMPLPKNIYQLWSLQGRLQSIMRFISQLAQKSHPFNHLLHKNVSFKWDHECETTFNQIKQYLMSPPILMPPTAE